MPIPAALAAGIASAAISQIGNIALSERQRKVNEEYTDKMNEYNTPENQLKRLQAAGISPNALSMGNNGMSVSGNVSSPYQPYSAPVLADPLSIISNSFLSMSQAKTEDETRDIKKAEIAAQIEVLRSNAEKLGVDTQYQSILNTFAAAKEMTAIESAKSVNRLNHYQVAKLKQEAKNLAYQLDNILPEEVKKLVAESNLTVGQLDLLVAQLANVNADTALKESQTETSEEQTKLVASQAEGQELSNARYDEVTDALLNQYQATINKLAAETGLTEQESFYYLYELARKYGIKLFGIPVPGQGGYRELNLNDRIQRDASNRYGAGGLKTDNLFK